MVNFNCLDENKKKVVNVKSIREDRHELRMSRKFTSEEEAIEVTRNIKCTINGVNYYPDKKNGGFIVKTYQAFKTLEDAVIVRDFLTKEIDKYKKRRQKEIEKQEKKNKSRKAKLSEIKFYEDKKTGQLSFRI